MNRIDEISANLEKVNEQIKLAAEKANRSTDEITLIAVTKTFPVSDIEILYSLGIREFGENRDQEASGKVSLLPDDVKWHFQGQIQSNKLKSITSWASYIHSVDQLKYAQIISQHSGGIEKPIFIQVSLDKPPQSRSGVNPSNLLELAGAIYLLQTDGNHPEEAQVWHYEFRTPFEWWALPLSIQNLFLQEYACSLPYVNQ